MGVSSCASGVLAAVSLRCVQPSNAARRMARGFQHGFYEHKTTSNSYRGSAGCTNGMARGRSFPARATGPKPLPATTALPGSPASQHNEDAPHFPWYQAQRVPPRELRSSPVCLAGDVPAPRPVVKHPLCPVCLWMLPLWLQAFCQTFGSVLKNLLHAAAVAQLPLLADMPSCCPDNSQRGCQHPSSKKTGFNRSRLPTLQESEGNHTARPHRGDA